MESDLSINDVKADPLIALLMQADGVRIEDLEILLKATTQAQVERLETRIREQRAREFYQRLDLSLAGTSTQRGQRRTRP
ncbi:hypothetical protein [Rhizobium straminoryzae]|uniref:Uncharacterized protein n=2 Tax=Rhizobium TaxID=379 RepID=A0A549SRK5_9HYPH|nr:hypothetical protein [Rhizobium straminoryzae]TRL32262.1 hypothetical protein FNA46_23655 [Rhizobium straminoryzae]